MDLNFVEDCFQELSDDAHNNAKISHGKIIDLSSMKINTTANIEGNDFRVTLQKSDIKENEVYEFFEELKHAVNHLYERTKNYKIKIKVQVDIVKNNIEPEQQ